MKLLLALAVATLFLAPLLPAREQDDAAATPGDQNPFGWLEGHWVGQGFGGLVEEVWLPLRGGAMLCTFRMIQNDQVILYEIVTIEPGKPGGAKPVMRLKHFDPDLSSWEAKDECLVWPLESQDDKRARFGPVEYALTGEDELTAWVEVSQGGETTTQELVFQRAR